VDAGVITAANAAVKSGKLRQVASGCCYTDDGQVQLHDAKIDALEDLVEEMNGEPLLVLVAFTHEVERIRERLGKDIPYLGGGMSASESNRVIDAWNRGEIPVLLGHPASMGHGLNLQDGGAHTLCWFGLTWSGEQHEQAIARLYRQGQQHPTVCHYILGAGTVDERVLAVLRDKAAGQSALLDALRKK
jgi:SNF2 family DNA or RNA helicase